MAMNKLCGMVKKKPALTNKLEDTINMVGSYRLIIQTDLKDSFWQRKITDSKLGYFGFHGPYSEDYIFLRSSQGFLNQSEELEQMLQAVLKPGVMEGWTQVQHDNIYVLGNDYETQLENWTRTLQACRDNNIKLSPHKTQVFPDKLKLLGWTKQGKYLCPDEHRQNTLIQAELPKTVRDLRSFLGSYNTFYKAKANLSLLLHNLMQLTSNNNKSTAAIKWTDELRNKFYQAQKEAAVLDKLYIPTPDNQLVQTQDYCQRGTDNKGGISATLWAITGENETPEVVARFSTPLQPMQFHLLPCEGEAMAAYVASRCPTFRAPILASKRKVISLVNNKPLYEAALLLGRGKFSSSRLLNNVLASMSDLNLEIQHISGKYGWNFPDDFTSRNPSKCNDPETCKMCSFINECIPDSSNGINIAASRSSNSIVGNIQLPRSDELMREMATGKRQLPFDNRKAMAFLQDQD